MKTSFVCVGFLQWLQATWHKVFKALTAQVEIKIKLIHEISNFFPWIVAAPISFFSITILESLISELN